MVRSDLDLKRREYDWTVNTEFTMHALGEAFQWGHEARSDDFTVKVTSIEEQTGTNGIPSECFNWITDYSLIYSDYFDGNGKLITPYTRHNSTDADGVNSQRKTFLSVRHCPINAMRLYYYVCRDCISETHGNTHLSFEEVMTNYKELGCPGFESVRRTRQKIQAILPELGCSPAARRRRNKGVIAYTNYALDKEGKESINALTEN